MPSSLQQLIDSVVSSPLAMVITNPRRPDNPIEVVNAGFCALTGYQEAEVVGRNCRFLSGQLTDQSATGQIRSALAEPRPVLVDILNYRRDGSLFRNGVTIAPLFDENGELAWFLGSQVDLGDGVGPVLPVRQARARSLVSQLPVRQRQVLEGIASGLLNKQIAFNLGIAEKTVKMHRSLLLERLQVGTSAEAVRIAVEAGL